MEYACYPTISYNVSIYHAPVATGDIIGDVAAY